MVFADAINAYDAWRWSGFSYSPPAGTTSIQPRWDSVSPASVPVSSSLPSSSAPSGSQAAPSYDAWRFGGFVRNSAPSFDAAPFAAPISAFASTPDITIDATVASLSGFCYVDVDKDGKMTPNDWAISDAGFSLSDGSANAPLIVYSKPDGSYSFPSITPGTYAITMLTPCSVPGVDTLGTLVDNKGDPVDPGKVEQDKFFDIVLKGGYTGTNYNFAEYVYPVDAVLQASADGRRDHSHRAGAGLICSAGHGGGDRCGNGLAPPTARRSLSGFPCISLGFLWCSRPGCPGWRDACTTKSFLDTRLISQPPP